MKFPSYMMDICTHWDNEKRNLPSTDSCSGFSVMHAAYKIY